MFHDWGLKGWNYNLIKEKKILTHKTWIEKSEDRKDGQKKSLTIKRCERCVIVIIVDDEK